MDNQAVGPDLFKAMHKIIDAIDAVERQDWKKLISPPPPPQEQTSFTLFPNFLPELRTLIWEFASYHSRIIQINDVPDLSYCDFHGIYTHRLNEQYHLPPLLHTCFEARTEALKHYELCSRVKLPPLATGAPLSVPGAPIYINFEADHFLLPFVSDHWSRDRHERYNFDIEVINRIKYLDLPCNYCALQDTAVILHKPKIFSDLLRGGVTDDNLRDLKNAHVCYDG